MYFIVVGHTFPIGYKSIYAFSVPLFFILSGFVWKERKFDRKYFRDSVIQIGVPMVIYALAYTLFKIWHGRLWSAITVKAVSYWLLEIACGFQGETGGFQELNLPGLNVCWFLYSLLILRLAFSILLPLQRKWLIPITIAISVYWGYNEIEFCNAWADAVLMYPFFYLGRWLGNYRERIEKFNVRSWFSILFLISSIIVLWFLPDFNDWPKVYMNSYGLNYFLFLIGIFSGTYIIFVVARLLPDKFIVPLMLIASGNILTLGTHLFWIHLFHKLPINGSMIQYVYAVIIMVIAYPGAKLANNHFPI